MMVIDSEETKKYFRDKLEERYFDYLKERNIHVVNYEKFLRDGKFGFPETNEIYICDEEYMVEMFLGASDESIYDLIRTNQIYGIKPEEGTIFAVLEGDDYLFFKPNDEAVYFCYRDTEEIFKIADSFDEFLDMVEMV